MNLKKYWNKSLKLDSEIHNQPENIENCLSIGIVSNQDWQQT